MLLNGMRKAVMATVVGSSKVVGSRKVADGGKAGDSAIIEMKCAMGSSLQESIHQAFDPRNLDASVEEVFRLMLGVNCQRYTGPAETDELESVSAVVGFGGLISGACVFRSGASTAIKIATRMTGMEHEEVDDTVQDGIGEICNMLAGAWKSKVPDLAANCCLSILAVVTGRDYNIHAQAPEFKLHHTFKFDDASFEVTIICDSLQ